jgi:hypothetical protein
MADSMKKQRRKGCKTRVRLAVLEVISLAKDSLTWAQGWASESHKSDSRLVTQTAAGTYLATDRCPTIVGHLAAAAT